MVAGFFALQGAEAGRLEAGQAAVEAGDWEAAVDAFSQALNTQPALVRQQVTEAAALRGLAHYQQGNYGAALADFDAALQLNPNLVDVLAYRSMANYHQNDHEAALADGIAAFEHKDLLPNHLKARLYAQQAAIYHQQGPADDVIAKANAAFVLEQYLSDATVAELYAERAQSVYDGGNPEESMTDTLAALSFDEDLPEATQAHLYANLATTYYQEDLFELALEAGDSALALETLPEETLVDLYLMRADMRHQQGDLAGAIDEAKEAADHGSDEAMLHALQAVRYYQARDNQALVEAEAALAIDGDSALAHRVRGSILAWQGQLDEALDDLDRAVELDPADVEALAMRVFAHLELDDLESAEADLAQAQENEPGSPSTLWADALVHHYKYENDSAHALLDVAIEMDDSRPEFYTWRARTYRLTSEDDQVTADLERALALDDDFPEALAGLMGQRISQNNYEGLEEEATRLIALYPEWPAGYGLMAFYQSSVLDDQVAAMEYAEQALTLRPEATQSYLSRGWIYMADESYNLAQADFEKALEIRANEVDAIGGLAEVHWVQEEYDQALALLDEILSVSPNSPRAYVNQGWIYFEQGELEEAWMKAHQALAYDPDYPGALGLRAWLNMESGEYDRAQLDLHRILEEYPSDAGAHYDQARVYFFQGRWDEARDSAQQALEMDSGLTDAYFLLSWMAYVDEDLDEALKQTGRWLDETPDLANAHSMEGLIYNYQGQNQEAVDSFTAALEQADEEDPLVGETYLNRAYAYMGLGDEELALADLAAALETSPDLDIVDEAEIMLADSGLRATSIGGRRIIEDENNGFTISYDEMWRQWAAVPAEGYVLSLGYGDEILEASVDVFLLEWDPNFSIRDLASVIDPSGQGVTVEPLESVQIAGQNGLKRAYNEFVDVNTVIRGDQYIVVKGNQAAVIVVSALDEVYSEFASEFEEIVASFDFLP
jgi:tetratricopeptide (TPR) repeat protein